MKRYWSALPPVGFIKTAEEAKAWNAFDAKLESEDILEMQKIDADCNDCKHFKRGTMDKVGGLTVFHGECLKFNKPMNAWPMQYSGHPCFEHRKA